MKNLKWIVVLAVALVGCSVSPENMESSASNSKSASIKSVTSPAVQRQGDGSWISSTFVTGPDHQVVDMYKIWVDAKVQNWAYNKTFGLIWTMDNWQSSHVSYGNYELNYGDGTERWGIDLGPWDERWVSGNFEYTIFVEMNGQTYYDNNNGQNYLIQF